MRWWVAVLIAAMTLVAHAQMDQLNERQLARYHELNAELRCLICQNRSIAESDAPLAKDLRTIVANQIAAGRRDDEIKQYLVDRYGEWVLYDPPFQWSTALLWLGPFGLLIAGLVIVLLLMRRGSGAPSSGLHLDRERLARVLDEHHERDSSSGHDHL